MRPARAQWFGFCEAALAMRLAPFLLALIFALTASMPCAPPAQAALASAGHDGPAHAAVADEDAPPCHAAPKAASLSAVCPCGCGERAPANVSVGSLGVALLPSVSSPPEASELAATPAATPGFASAPPRAIEKIPRSA